MKQIEYLQQVFWITENIRNKASEDFFIKLFLNRTDDLKPNTWYCGHYTNKRKIKIDENTETVFRQALYDNNVLQFSFGNSTRGHQKIRFDFSIGIIPSKFNDLSISISHDFFQSTNSLNTFMDIFYEIALKFNCKYGLIHDMSDSLRISQNKPYDVLNKIPDIFWGNYLGNEYISKIGRKKLLSLETTKVKRIGNGIYIQLTDSPFDFKEKNTEKIRQRIKKQIGIGFFGFNEKVINLYHNIIKKT